MARNVRKAAKGHADKMCAMTCCSCHLDIKRLKPLVRKPKFLCETCGRVAAKKRHLCRPVSLV